LNAPGNRKPPPTCPFIYTNNVKEPTKTPAQLSGPSRDRQRTRLSSDLNSASMSGTASVKPIYENDTHASMAKVTFLTVHP
jgi:hypothetical protein